MSKPFRDRDTVVGRLLEHGPAPYNFEAGQSASYFAKILSTDGLQVLWGIGLARAITESATHVKVGDIVGARRTGVEVFTFGQRVVRRNKWLIEGVQFFTERSRQGRRDRDDYLATRKAIKERPELKSSFLSLRAAEQYAERRIADPEDRAEFLKRIRSVLEGSIVKGMPVPEPRVRARIKKEETPPDPNSRDRSRTR